jgi:hypothetical protein
MNIGGYFSLLDGKIVRLVTYVENDDENNPNGLRQWELITDDLEIATRYHFVINNNSYYSLSLIKSHEIRAFSLNTMCTYRGGGYSISTVNNRNNNLVVLLPTQETHDKLGLHPYNDGWTEVNLDDWRRDVEEIWQVREPIDGFVFDVAPMVYIKKKDEPYDEEKWKRISETGSDE